MGVLPTSFASGDALEKGIAAELNGKPNAALLRQSYDLSVRTVDKIDVMLAQLRKLRALGRSAPLQPEFEAALAKILAASPPIERVSLSNARYANIGESVQAGEHLGSTGKNLDEVIGNLIGDLEILRAQLVHTNAAFRDVLPVAETGGFSSMVLSGRSAFPDGVMQGEDMLSTYIRFYSRACLTTISATMQSYPKGMGWLPKPMKR
jgi:hypothetical protein